MAPPCAVCCEMCSTSTGLVMCGWSAEWDAALHKALSRSANRRFSMYWMLRSSVTSEAANLIEHRRAIEVEIADADDAFDALAQHVSALESIADRAPQDTRIAVALLKRYLPDPVRRIDLHDLISDETERLIGEVLQLTSESFQSENRSAEHMAVCEAASARLIALLATGAYFSEQHEHDENWRRCVERLAGHEPPSPSSSSRALRALQLYPCLLAIYSIAVSSIATGRLEPFVLVLASIRVTHERVELPIGFFASLTCVFGDADESWPGVPVNAARKSPWSQHLCGLLRSAVAEIVPDERRYEAVFYEAEYLLGLVYEAQSGLDSGSIGRIVDGDLIQDDLPTRAVDRHADLLIEAGIFGSHDHIENLRSNYDNDIRRLSRRLIRPSQ